MTRYLLALLTTILLSCAACNGAPSETDAPVETAAPIQRPTKVFVLSAAAEAISTTQILIEGETTLPDGSLLTVSVKRYNSDPRDEERHWLASGPPAGQAKVHDGSFSIEVTTNDQYQLDRMILDSEASRVGGGPVCYWCWRPLGDLRIGVEFVPDEQRADVVAAVGGRAGPWLDNSPQLYVYGPAMRVPTNRLRVTFDFEHPFAFPDDVPY